MRTTIPIVLLLLSVSPAAAWAQDEQPAQPAQLSDVQRMARDGRAEELDRRFGGGRTPTELGLLAEAYRNRAKKLSSSRRRRGVDRQALYGEAEQRYLKWIDALEKSTEGSSAKRDVDLARARVDYAGMILALWLSGDLNQFEITSGMRGDRDRLLTLLGKARKQYEEALELLGPLYEDRFVRQDEFLAENIFDAIRQLRLDSILNVAWVAYYIGVAAPDDALEQRQEALELAERKFQELVDSGEAGEAIYQCYMGLGMAIREQRRFDEAVRNFTLAMEEGVEPVVEAQARYESARCHLLAERFDEGRATLEPLASKDLRNLAPEDRQIQFYIYLAKLWDANSHLVEAEALRRSARRAGAGRRAIQQKAKRTRELGLSKMNRLRGLGGPWPAVVQLYIAATIKLDADPKTLEPTELLSLAMELMRAKKPEDACVVLEEAASRKGVEKGLAGDVLFELGKCHYRLTKERLAAAAFQKMAAQHRSHEQAPQAASFAYQLWAELAKQSKSKSDYGRLADTLLNLVQSFPGHEKRAEAMWWLPGALQSAGRYQEASEQFAKVPEDSPHWEEAQFRAVLCARRACDAQRGSIADEAYVTRARLTATKLSDYADKALLRADSARDGTKVRDWSAEARVNAAELLLSAGQFNQALQALEGFEGHYPDSAMTGRALAVRIRAHRGLRQYEQAKKILDQYLQTVSPDKARPVLTSLATGMQDEVERLLREGQPDAARALAVDAVSTFQELEKWFLADEKRAQGAQVVQIGLAQMHLAAGQLDEANRIVTTLLVKRPKNGNLQRLRAVIATARLGEDAAAEQLVQARKAWEVLLNDPIMRTRAPERFWEARYNWLALRFREGQATEVYDAIKQERIWYPELGGPPWKERLETLYNEAAAQLGKEPIEPPAPPPEADKP